MYWRLQVKNKPRYHLILPWGVLTYTIYIIIRFLAHRDAFIQVQRLESDISISSTCDVPSLVKCHI